MVDEAAAGLAHIVSKLFNYCFGWLLKRFRYRIDRMPNREFSELALPGKIGRLLLMATVLVVVCAPLAWLIWH
jgi:hypothetical protein